MSKLPTALLAAVAGAAFLISGAAQRRRAAGRQRPRRQPAMLHPGRQGDQVLQVAGEEGPVPDRPGQRLRRQHLAHPDDQDRQGLCRAAGGQERDQGVQGHLDRHRRRRPARRDRGLHQPGLRRHRDHRGQPDRLRPRDPPGQQQGRRAHALRQHPRHRPGHGGRRGPVQDGHDVGRVDREIRRPQGPPAGSARRARQLRRSRPPSRLPLDRRQGAEPVRGGRGGRQLGDRRQPEGHRRRDRRARAFRRRVHPGRLGRHGAGVHGRQTAVRTDVRRGREQLPQADRRALRRTG